MVAGRSFEDYVKRKCYNGLFSAAEDYICENAYSIGFRTYRVHRVGAIDYRITGWIIVNKVDTKK